MKKNLRFVSLALLSLCSLALAGCGETTPDTPDEPDEPVAKTINLVYSGTGTNKYFNESLFDDFKTEMKANGDINTYNITYVEHGPDKVDSEVTDWKTGPDVYEFASDKVSGLYSKGALAELKGDYKSFVTTANNSFGVSAATFNEKLIAYPYTGDNTYYLQYDKSVLTEDDVSSIEKLLAKANTLGKKVGYNLPEGFWGAAAMFTFGADYSMTFDDQGQVSKVDADFDSEKGIKAAKAIYSIVTDKAWVKDMEAPSESNNLIACMAGTWDISNYKTALKDNYGCAVMPNVTVDGETKHLGAFLGGKLFGVNPQVSSDDNDRLTAAHKLAMFLSGEKCQLKRFYAYETAPCNKTATASEAVTSNANVKVLSEQGSFAHAQTSVPGNFWTAPATLINGMIDGTVTLDNLSDACKTLNDNIKASK
ncbi:MAG: extracellular solute-binding protein [Bacilli bacterium]